MSERTWKTFVEDPGGKIIRLARPKMKGLFGLIFSRTVPILLLMAIQVAIVVMLLALFHEYLPHYRGVMVAFTLVMLLYLFNCSMDSTAKLTWMILLAVAPVAGALFLAFTKADFGHRKIRAQVEANIEDSRDVLPQPEGVLEKLEEGDSGLEDLCRYLNRSGCFPLYGNTKVTYFPLGEAKFEAMLEQLRRAEKYIFMEYFIIEEGEMWGRILKILEEKAQQGVDVRVMYDGMCEISKIPYHYAKDLGELGIKAKAFSPIRPLVTTQYNYRDHRKILAIDGKVAFNGGVNLGDEYINRISPFGHWKDTALMLEGEAAESFALMFLTMWNIDEPEREYRPYLTEPEQREEPGFVMPFGDCPLDDDKVGESVYMDILYRATDYVHIMTPYLILDGELEMALKYAAERGVDVRIILPGIPDKKPAYALAKSHYKSLVQSGVKIYEYTPGFVHAKVFVSDDKKAVVGTINLDYRSLYHHFECGTYLYDVPCIREIEADYLLTQAQCREVTLETIQNESIFYKVGGSVMKLIAPLM